MPQDTDLQTSHFPQFQKLPAELRYHIWRFCLRQTTLVLGWVREFREPKTRIRVWSSWGSWQPISSACGEAKREALLCRKSFRDLGLGCIRSGSDFLDPSTDTLYIQAPDPHPHKQLSSHSALTLCRLLFSGISIGLNHRIIDDWNLWKNCSPDSTIYELWNQLEGLARTSPKPQRWQVVVMETEFMLTRDEALSSGLWGPWPYRDDITYYYVDEILNNPLHALWRTLRLHAANFDSMLSNFDTKYGRTRGVELLSCEGEGIQAQVDDFRQRLLRADTSSQWFDREWRREHVKLNCAQSPFTGSTSRPPSEEAKEKWIGLCDKLGKDTLRPAIKLQWSTYVGEGGFEVRAKRREPAIANLID